MINLLSGSQKNDIVSARVNLIITRYIAIILLAFAFLGGVFFVSYTILTSIKTNADSVIEANDVNTTAYAETSQQVDALNAKLSDAKSVLDSEVRYSHILVQLGQLMPAGTVLDAVAFKTIDITSTAPVTLKVYGKSTSELSQLQAQFQSSSLFSQVVPQSPPTESGGINGYPAVATFSVVFNGAGI